MQMQEEEETVKAVRVPIVGGSYGLGRRHHRSALQEQDPNHAHYMARGGSSGKGGQSGHAGWHGKGQVQVGRTSLSSEQCGICKGFGHWSNECPKKDREASVVQVEER
ncbi:hypothetical protein R1flu_011985 [Riccia fluitans]|uniref:CCHC-type domain-containing protein n=1 Tax=Riccia fluitans TaxID=41844 RepID=A0ABD1Z9B9_9MARC